MNEREFELAMFFPDDSPDDDVESEEIAWSIEDFDDDEEDDGDQEEKNS